MNWTEVKAIVTTEAVEAVSTIFMEFGATGVSIVDAKDIENYKVDPYGEILDKEELLSQVEDTTVSAYFPETIFLGEVLPEIKQRITELNGFGIDTGKNIVEVTTLDDENWASAWKKYYSPKRLTRFLTVVPSWEKYEVSQEDEKCIFLDPGMAFGTGTHPTTKLTLVAMEQIFRGNEVVLDVGTGSGVLSIAASLLGAKEVNAFDLDEVAVNQAKENIALNPVSNVHVATGDLLKNVTIEADIIVANILADILILMLEDAKRLLKEEGYLILSGIINDKKEMILDKIHEVGFVVTQTLNEGEWNALILKHPSSEDGKIIGG